MNKHLISVQYLLLVCVYALSVSVGSSQVLINEFVASNSSDFTDPQFHESGDWLEIHNSGSASVDLSGYFLTDNISNPDKWQIPANTILDAGAYLIFWADGQDTGLHTSFKLAAEGEEIGLFNTNQVVVDTLTYTTQITNVSYGRNTNLSGWGFFDVPTPGAANDSPIYSGFTNFYPEFSLAGGLKDAPVTVSIQSQFGGTLRYTIDGSMPVKSSPIYVSSLQVAKNTVIRARVFENGKLPGPVVTHTYFIADPIVGSDIPVISIASDPANFWDSKKGIYVQDFKPEWEIPINIEMFENRGEDRAAFNEQAGTKVNGLYSWQLPQKMLGVYFRKEYGKGELDYQLLYDRSRNSFDNFALRASGNDWSSTLFKDLLLQRNTQTNMNIPTMGYRQVVVFINGEFMGIHNIRSKVDEDFVADNFHVEKGTFDMIENEDYVEAGSLDGYTHFLSLLEKDLSNQSNFDAVAAEMDLDNFTDYVITEIAVCNTSIGHNVMAWKPKEGGKWQWILMDLDRAYGSMKNIDFFLGKSELPLKELLKNAAYHDRFFQRLNDQLYTTFNNERIGRLAAELQATIEPAIQRHIDRWEGTSSSYGDPIHSVSQWHTNIQDLSPSAKEFRDNILSDMSNYGYGGTVNLDLSTQPEGAGEITLNGLQVDEINGAAPFIKGMSMKLKATPKLGYQFVGWTDELGAALGNQVEYTETVNADHHVIAKFESLGMCIIPAIISADMTLDKSCNPYFVPEDVLITNNVTVTIGEGVVLKMASDVQWMINGALIVNGTSAEPVSFESFSEEPWRALIFENTSTRSRLANVTISNASRGKIPTRNKAAISSFNADLTMDHLTITDVNDNPIFAQYSDIVLTNSTLRSAVSGDLINVKYGTAQIEDCDFTGNTSPDADGIDYDEILGGTILNCTFQDFLGFNSDAIDIGEKAKSIKIQNVIAKNIADKGVSVGQQSSASVENSLFINTAKGIGIKDSSWVSVDQCTFYNSAEAISCYEKNPGRAGGNAVVTNSILANSPLEPYFSDDKSFISISNSLSDTKELPAGFSNVFDDAYFKDPVHDEFELLANSPALTAGLSSGPIGAQINSEHGTPNVMFVLIFADQLDQGAPEFLAIYNPTNETQDLSGYKITRGVTHTFPDETLLAKGDTLWLSNAYALNFSHAGLFQQWEDGQLANGGETIQLENQYSMVIDHVKYDNKAPWPADGLVFALKSSNLPNHLGKNWEGLEYAYTIPTLEVPKPEVFRVFPNPGADFVQIDRSSQAKNQLLLIYSLSGQLIDRIDLERAHTRIPLSPYPKGMLIFKLGGESLRVMHTQ